MYQKIILIGNLGKDPEMHFNPDGKAITGFNVAPAVNIAIPLKPPGSACPFLDSRRNLAPNT